MSKSQNFEVNFLPSRQSCVRGLKKAWVGVSAQGLRVGKATKIALPSNPQNENKRRALPLASQGGQANRLLPSRASLKLQVSP